MKPLSRILATFFGIGLFPIAPGTVTSAVVAFAYQSLLHRLSWPVYVLMVVGVFFAGAWAAARHAAEIGRPDPGRIVVDEVCGQLVALAFLPAGWLAVAASFTLFRFFDILKPWPIRRLEALPGGWGIMADDIGAGLAAAVLGRLILHAV